MSFDVLENMTSQELERTYPDLYRAVYPHISNVADQIGTSYLDPNSIGSLTSEIARRSGFDVGGPAVEAAAYGGYGRRHGWDYGHRHGHHSHGGNFMPDFIRILLMRELFNRRRRRW